MSLAGTLITPRIDSKIRRVSKYNRRPTDFKDILRQVNKYTLRIHDEEFVIKYAGIIISVLSFSF